MRRRLPALVTLAVVVVVLAVAGTGAWREATVQGWLEDGYPRLARDAFWHRFDRTAPIGLGVLVALAVVASLVGRWVPSRREIALPIVLVAAVAIGRVLGFAADAICPRRPSVLLLSIDTLRPDRLGAYGYDRPTSPVLDRRLADAGVVFEEAWSQSPKTTPSHMTMLTSLAPSVHGVPLWTGSGAAPSLNPRVHTLAEVLKSEGYATAAFTAGAHVHRDRGFGQGFDVYKHGSQLARTLEWLDGHHGRPFFLFFHTYEVHDPYTPPPDVAAAFMSVPVPAIDDAVARVRAGVDGWPQAHKTFWQPVDGADPRHIRHVSDLYDAAIAQMDGTTLAALLDALDRLGIADDTMVVLTADHGEAFHEHGIFLHEDLYPETLRVPLVIRFPRGLPRAHRVRAPVRVIDLMPTILDLLGLPVPAQAQGMSLAPLARDDEHAPTPRAVFAEYSDPATGRVFESLRTPMLTLIRDGARAALFDRNQDPGEHRDLAARDPARTAALRAELDRWHETNLAAARRWHPRGVDVAAPSPKTLEQLRALGYVE